MTAWRVLPLAGALLLGVSAATVADDPLYGYDRSYLDERDFWGYSCDELWFMRNLIYANAGYCFVTERAISVFGNEGCIGRSDSLLNRFETANVQMIRRVERRKGCG